MQYLDEKQCLGGILPISMATVSYEIQVEAQHLVWISLLGQWDIGHHLLSTVARGHLRRKDDTARERNVREGSQVMRAPE